MFIIAAIDPFGLLVYEHAGGRERIVVREELGCR